MVSSDDEIPEDVFKVVDAFIPKDEAASRLLPILTKICGESSPGFPDNSAISA
jgi:hypothetical protein